jgi:dihydroflavonol-4-reductase
MPKDENELIVPARDGALRVLRAAREAGVKRVVLTSSFAAIGYGHAPRKRPFDEGDWTNLASEGLSAYIKSKTIAERAAWDFVLKEGGPLELATVNPVAVYGPVLGKDFASSIKLVQSMLQGKMPGVPRLYFGCVDVRDVADLHLRAMTHPDARGERFLAVADDALSLFEIASILRKNLGARAAKAPRRELPDFLVRAVALFRDEARQAVPELGKVKHLTNGKARRILGWSPRSSEEAVVATAESLYRLNLI